MIRVGLAGVGSHLPGGIRDAAEIGRRAGIPEDVIRSKFGIDRVRVAGPGETMSMMATAAARQALGDFPAADLDLLVYCGSEHKDFSVWSAASDVARQLGAERAAAFEIHALCAGTPISIRVVRALMAEDERVRSALIVGGGRENDLVDYANRRARFIINFGAGTGALLLRRDHPNRVVGAAMLTDPGSSRDVLLGRDGTFDVPDPAGMKARLDGTSLANFRQVAERAMAPTGRTSPDFVALTHMKRSMHEAVLATLGVGVEGSVYLEDTGHMQAADQAVALQRGLASGRVRPGDLVLLLAAGTGYTWSAAAIEWEGAA